MSLGPKHVTTRRRVTPPRLLCAALGALLLTYLTVRIYPHLVQHGAASGLITLTWGLAIAAFALTLLLPVAAIILRLAQQDEPSR